VSNELRVRTNFAGGLVEDNPLTSTATTLTSAGLASLPAVGSTQHMALIVDPDAVGGNPEIVHVTAHTALATTATIVRAREGTAGREHLRDTPWLHGPTVRDFPLIVAKTADETVTASTVMQNDDILSLPVEANTRYALTLCLMFNAPATPDLKIGWAYPSGTTLKWHRESTGVTGATKLADALVETDIEPIAGDGADDVFVIQGLVTVGSTAGNVTFQWAQNVSDASGTIVRAGSWFRLEAV
jgi:hypothetical protein